MNQPILSFEDRMRAYQAELRAAVLQQLLIGLPLCFGILWAVSETLTEITLPLPWWALAPIVWCVLAVPPVLKSLPDRPRPEDVELDRAMRRAAGVE